MCWSGWASRPTCRAARNPSSCLVSNCLISVQDSRDVQYDVHRAARWLYRYCRLYISIFLKNKYKTPPKFSRDQSRRIGEYVCVCLGVHQPWSSSNSHANTSLYKMQGITLESKKKKRNEDRKQKSKRYHIYAFIFIQTTLPILSRQPPPSWEGPFPESSRASTWHPS
jgi:hypothetical protein